MTTITTTTTGSSASSELLDLGDHDSVMSGCVDELAATKWDFPMTPNGGFMAGEEIRT